jgi:hypothetical protein
MPVAAFPVRIVRCVNYSAEFGMANLSFQGLQISAQFVPEAPQIG